MSNMTREENRLNRDYCFGHPDVIRAFKEKDAEIARLQRELDEAKRVAVQTYIGCSPCGPKPKWLFVNHRWVPSGDGTPESIYKALRDAMGGEGGGSDGHA